MTLSTDNPTLNKAIIAYKKAITNVDKAINQDDISIEELELLEDKEQECDEVFFNLVFSMMPKNEANSMKEPKYLNIFKSKVIDKYILS